MQESRLKQKTAQTEALQLEKEEILKEISKERAKGKSKRELKNLAVFLGLLSLAVSGRVAAQWIPSVEPIIPLAIAAGMVWGAKEGFALGGAAYIISNFFIWGLQGPWTIFQALGAALPGAAGGVFGKLRKPKTRDLIVLSVLGTVFFEIVMNISGSFMLGTGLAFGLLAIPFYFMASLPFSAAHIGSNAVFARMAAPLLKLRREENELKVVSITRVDGGKRTDVRMYKSGD